MGRQKMKTPKSEYQKASNKRQAREKTENRPENQEKQVRNTRNTRSDQGTGTREETDEPTKSSNTNLINEGMRCRWRQC